mgnify:FL=1
MNRNEAISILEDAISEAYPYWSSDGYMADYDKATEALEYLKNLGGVNND